jgi:hypothetical protein
MLRDHACARGGCTAGATRTYCSQRCAQIEVARRKGHAYYAAIGKQAWRNRKKCTRPIRQSERMLMASGRFDEAARSIYQRAYGSGWIAGRRGFRQLTTA